MTVLGEIPDRDAALRELRRGVRPGGRGVVGETILHPPLVGLAKLEREGAEAGRRLGRGGGRPPFGFYARLPV